MARAVAADQVDGHSHAFQVVTALANETLLFAAESSQDAKEWIRIIIVNLDVALSFWIRNKDLDILTKIGS